MATLDLTDKVGRFYLNGENRPIDIHLLKEKFPFIVVGGHLTVYKDDKTHDAVPLSKDEMEEVLDMLMKDELDENTLMDFNPVHSKVSSSEAKTRLETMISWLEMFEKGKKFKLNDLPSRQSCRICFEKETNR